MIIRLEPSVGNFMTEERFFSVFRLNGDFIKIPIRIPLRYPSNETNEYFMKNMEISV